MNPRRLLLLLLAIVAWPAAARAQGAWNDPRALDLVRRVHEHRSGVQRDTTLRHYAAEASGFVYFVLDLPERDEQVLVRTDQVALQIYWHAPDLVRQHIVGLRQRDELPVRRLYYYLDRLTMVQDNFGGAITIADGQNVDEVPHPAAAASADFYEYQLADSLTLRLPGADGPIPVLELRVRPRDPTRPAVVGSLFVDGRTGALVRMNFTFTRAAYTDRRIDYINVSLESGLWQGRYWLPHEQRVEIRREMPELDLPAGTIIRTRMRVNDYRFDEPVPLALFQGRAVTMAPREARDAYAFDEPIDAERRLEGISPPRDLAALQREARAHVRRQALGGLPRTRLQTGTASDVLRYNRAEGLALGLGATFPAGPARGWASVGWAFGAAHPLAEAGLTLPLGEAALSASAYLNRRREIGGVPVRSELLNTLSSALAGRDLSDLHFASGVDATLRVVPAAGWRIELGGWAERHRSPAGEATASLFGDLGRRAPLPIDDGDWAGAAVRATHRTRPGPEGVRTARLEVRAGAPIDPTAPEPFARLRGALEWERRWERREAQLDLRAEAGVGFGTLPRQELFLAGGQGTVPGYDFRSAIGDRMALASGVASAELWRPWARGRLLGAVGWTGAGAAGGAALGRWALTPETRALGSVGAGLGLFYDVLRVDLMRGLTRDGRWELTVEAHPRFRHAL